MWGLSPAYATGAVTAEDIGIAHAACTAAGSQHKTLVVNRSRSHAAAEIVLVITVTVRL